MSDLQGLNFFKTGGDHQASNRYRCGTSNVKKISKLVDTIKTQIFIDVRHPILKILQKLRNMKS